MPPARLIRWSLISMFAFVELSRLIAAHPGCALHLLEALVYGAMAPIVILRHNLVWLGYTALTMVKLLGALVEAFGPG